MGIRRPHISTELYLIAPDVQLATRSFEGGVERACLLLGMR